jgi:hypothetical protein
MFLVGLDLDITLLQKRIQASIARMVKNLKRIEKASFSVS